MIPFHVTLTGADEATDLDALCALAQEFPFVEWGILFSPSNEGTGRFPSAAWRRALLTRAQAMPLALAAHLCGQAVKAFAQQDPHLLAELQGFQRIQFNFNARQTSASRLAALRQACQAQAERRPDQRFITQHNAANAEVWTQFAAIPGTQVLFDASGGVGRLPEQWPAPLPGWTCGFAGGLAPDNVVEQMARIRQVTQGEPFWIDMESGVRTNDRFDVAACRRVLEQVQAERTRLKESV